MTAPIQGATFQHVECEGDHSPPPQNLPGARHEPHPDSRLTKYPVHSAIQTTHSMAGSPPRDDSLPPTSAHTQPDLKDTPCQGLPPSVSAAAGQALCCQARSHPKGVLGARPGLCDPWHHPGWPTDGDCPPHPHHGRGQPHLLAQLRLPGFQLCCGPRQCKAIRLPTGCHSPHGS